MISNLEKLSYRNEPELKDPLRLKSLFWHNQVETIVMVILVLLIFGVPFFGGVFVLLFFIIKDAAFRPFWYLVPIFILIVGVIGWYVWGFVKELMLDPIPHFLKRPGDFEFLEGNIVEANVSMGERRSDNKVLAIAHFKNPRNEKDIVIEIFRARIWKFGLRIGQEPDPEGQSGSPVSSLPVPVIVLSEKREPFRRAIVGIKEEELRRQLPSA